MKQSGNLSVILNVKHKKINSYLSFPWFLILGKIKEGNQDGDHVYWRHHHHLYDLYTVNTSGKK